MPTYEQVNAAGDLDGQNVYQMLFSTEDCSDFPQIQAWDDFNMNSVAIESLQGTANNSGESLVAAAHTTNSNTGGVWVPGSGTAGGGATQQPGTASSAYRANRLRGTEQYLNLADPADAAPLAGEVRKFSLAFGAADDSTTGTSGHLPVIAAKVFYAGAAPTVSFQYNSGTEGAPVWVTMTSEDKGTSMPIGILNTIHATGPATTTTALDPVVKPGSGEKWAEEQWILTAL